MNNRMTFRSEMFDIGPIEARRLHVALKAIVDQWDGQSTVQALNTTYIQKAEELIQQMNGRRRYIPSSMPSEFVLVNAPSPKSTTFDDWMQKHRAMKEFDDKNMHRFPYGSYNSHPVRHLSGFVKQHHNGVGRSCYAYFVPHRKAKSSYDPRSDRAAPFVLHYNFAYPIFQTIDLHELEVTRGPYAGQRMIELFHEGPGVFLVKHVYGGSSFMQKYPNRRNIVYATWVAHLAPPYGTWRKHNVRKV